MKRTKMLLISFCIAILFTTFFTGCSKKTANAKSNDSSEVNPVSTQILNDLDLNLVYNQPNDFIDPNASFFSSNQIVTSTLKDYESAGYKHFTNNSALDDATIVSIVFSESGLDANYFPVLYLKGVSKNDLSEKNNIIKIAGNDYSGKELEDYIFYEDDKTIVYEISKLISASNIDERISELSKLDSSYDYSYLQKQATDILTHKDNFISFSYREIPESNTISDSKDNQIISFSNKDLDKIVRLNLNLDDSEPIYSDKLDTLLYLNYVSPASSSIDSAIAEDLNWESISSIEEIDKIKNLVAISLPDSSIKDLSPLKNLSSLM
ncbi:MAG: hypothetical protein N4A40_03245, partial [Tissierellales bacterium]|nr:hypothetical protein [Tissierellales bacterium]